MLCCGTEVLSITQHAVLWDRSGASLSFSTTILASHIKSEVPESKPDIRQDSSHRSFSTTMLETKQAANRLYERTDLFLPFFLTFYTSPARKIKKNGTK
jgi:hypothetical protein